MATKLRTRNVKEDEDKWGKEVNVRPCKYTCICVGECVLQAAAALLELNKKVAIALDGCGSQKEGDHRTAIQLLQSWSRDGCYVSTSESILMQLLQDAGDPLFKTVAPIMKQKHPKPF
ncbi:ribonuclease mar1 [Trypanosoma conorhini]|uniref:Ribonuclease mar1 n=1 Tax=Trypanosoma conorhini TaxID=83891 RepID=A0A3R7LTY6_9TRYP|nr:ribonuclease mar1 [Trypanosoma conorhini]RNF20663.1 ribonuclease mar1 [Trypanosoma conorhini]